MERVLLVLDELDDAVSMLRHVWLGASQGLVSVAAWFGLAIAPGLLLFLVRF